MIFAPTKKRLHKKQIIVLSISSIIVLFVGWWGWWQLGPKPLGSGLEYLGKSDYGCLWICDAEPGSKYFYATAMTEDELKTYFEKANFRISPGDGGGSSGDFSFQSLHFVNEGGKEFIIEFYTQPEAVARSYKLTPVASDKTILSINAQNYDLAKRSL